MILSSMSSSDLLICHRMASELTNWLEGNRILALAANRITGTLLAEITRRKLPLYPITMTYQIHISMDETLPDLEAVEIEPDALPVVDCEVKASTPAVISSLFAEFIDGLNLDGLPDGEGLTDDDE